MSTPHKCTHMTKPFGCGAAATHRVQRLYTDGARGPWRYMCERHKDEAIKFSKEKLRVLTVL